MKSVYLLKKAFVFALILGALLFVFFWTNMELISMEESETLPLSKGIPLNVKNKLCYVNLNDERNYINKSTDLRMIYFVTPTYPRPEQVPELTRLAHTLMLVPRIHWIIADDQPICSEPVYDILRRSGLPFTHLSSPKPYAYKTTNFPRGVANRRAALSWLKDNVQEGVLYFGDDDNTVDLQLFEEIRHTKKVSMFPVGLIGTYGVSTPIVKEGKKDLAEMYNTHINPVMFRSHVTGGEPIAIHEAQIQLLAAIENLLTAKSQTTVLPDPESNKAVVAFFDSWSGSRTFPVDMAGFAINIEYLSPKAHMPYIAGHEEDRFLVSLGLMLDDIEPLAANCSKILVWHTKTAKFKRPFLKVNMEKLEKKPKYGSFVDLLKETFRLGMASINTNNGTKPFIIRHRKQHETLDDLQ